MIDYGNPPAKIGRFHPNTGEMMFYLYLPIAIPGWGSHCRLPERLEIYRKMIGAAIADYISLDDCLSKPFVYLTAKTLWVEPGSPGNRPGWHCDGFGSGGDINYIWSDMNPTEFAIGDHFKISTDDQVSMREMENQSRQATRVTFPNNTLLRLDEGVIHRVGPVAEAGVRSFVKITFSKHQFLGEGNSKNHLFDYDWHVVPRGKERNLDHTPPKAD